MSEKKAKTLGENRNALGHMLGGVNADRPSRVLLVRDGKDESGKFIFNSWWEVDLTNVRQRANDIQALWKGLEDWPLKIQGAVHASPHMHREAP